MIKLAKCLFVLLTVTSCARQSAFRIVLLPDTQTYTQHHPEVFVAQVDWIVSHADSIQFVLHQGDITQNNNAEEWERAAKIMSKMDGTVPYTFVPGNHDMGSGPGKFADTRNTSLMNQYFPYDKYNKSPTFGGAFEKGKMDNTWHKFKAAGKEWIVLSLEFGPRNSVLEWAAGVIESHPRSKVILNTHAYLYYDNTHMSKDRNHKWLVKHYGIGKITGDNEANEGDQVWEKLVKRYPNILMVFNGHVSGEGVGRLVSTGQNGNKVYQMLANYQKEVSGTENGTVGFLRVVTVDVKNNRISVKTYSPHRDVFNDSEDHLFQYEQVDLK